MNDSVFRTMAAQMKPSDELVAGLVARLDTDGEVGKPRGELAVPPEPTAVRPRHRLARSVAWVAAAACVAAAASAGVWAVGEHPVESQSGPADSSAAGAPVDEPIAGLGDQGPSVAPATEYAGLYKSVTTAMAAWQKNGGGYPAGGGWVQYGGLTRGPVPMAAGGAYVMASDAGQPGYSGTNVQVAGIDEGDIVKTDGRALYVASGTHVAILLPEGSSTHEVANLDTAPSGSTVAGAVLDMLLDGETLVVFVQDYAAHTSAINGTSPTEYVPYDVTQTRAVLYDVSDPSNPTLLTSFGQSGSYTTSRLAGDVLYLVTDYTLNDPAKLAKDDPSTYVPQTSDGPRSHPLPPGDVYASGSPEQPRYAVASAVDLATKKRLGQQSVLVGADTVYMSQNNLYLAAVTPGGKDLVAAAKAAGLDASNVTSTAIVRIALNDGALAVAAQGAVLGAPINQFALDESAGHLRIVTDVSGSSASGAWVQQASLSVLNDKLKVVGSIPKLALNEQIRSVRFAGDVGYVVTFQQRDPLFAIDLSKPSKPTVMSALKIPGFSAYLHPWSDGRLLGVGVDAADDGTQTGLKLAMFDTKDPYVVTQVTGLHVPGDDSEALYNHKAVLVDTAQGLIGFPIQTWNQVSQPTRKYLVYSYSPADGFVLQQALKVAAGTDSVRGVLVGDYLYVCTTTQVDVYATDSLKKTTSVMVGGA